MERFRFLLLLAFVPLVYSYKSYEGYQVVRTAVLTKENVRMLANLQEHSDVDFWLEPRIGGHADIMVSPQYLSAFKSVLNSFGIKTSVLIENVETVVQKEKEQRTEIRRTQKIQGRATPPLTDFPYLSEVEEYLNSVVEDYPWTSLTTIGYSYEGRPLRVLKISNGVVDKPAMYLQASAHAREWIGPPTLIYFIHELTENLTINNNSELLDIADFYVLIISNPDGYRYTHTGDRYWRKTRNIISGSSCYGTDPNRNYDYFWDGLGSSPLPCSDTYRGEVPFSCPETKAISDFLAANTKITSFVDVHSYGQLVLTPWGDKSDLPSTYNELERIGMEAIGNLTAVYGTVYEFGTSYNVLYEVNGDSVDWTYAYLGIPLSYTIELPGGGTTGGLNPPPADIMPVSTETWQFYKSLIKNIPQSRH